MNADLHKRLTTLMADPILSDINNSMSNLEIENLIATELGVSVITLVVEKYDGDAFSK